MFYLGDERSRTAHEGGAQNRAWDRGSRVELSFELSGLISPLLSRLYGGMIQRYIATESEGLKQRSEAAA